MEYSFPRYLLAKQTVDDRALNKDVLAALEAELSAFDIPLSDSKSDSALRFPDLPRASQRGSSVAGSVSPACPAPSSGVHPLSAPLLTIVEVGAGIGTMLTRLLRWDILPPNVDYTLVDEMPENIAFARQWLPQWARENGYQVKPLPNGSLHLSASQSIPLPTSDLRFSDLPRASQRGSSVVNSVPRSVLVHFTQADVFDSIASQSIPPSTSNLRFSDLPRASQRGSSVVNTASQSVPPSADLLIAHAFLDLLPLPESLPKLFSILKPGGLAWLTINFDGVTTLEPSLRFSDLPRASQRGSSAVDSASRQPSAPESVDSLIERLYHQTMDTRPTGGDSRSGRHLFKHLEQAGAGILAAGASDWVVYPVKGQYPADEAYFLHFILRFFETSLANHPELDPRLLEEWLKQRRAQIERAELVYIAHQMDFLISLR